VNPDAGVPPGHAALRTIPRDVEGPVFRAPWEAQAFAMAVKLHEAGHFTWPEWAEYLGAALRAATAQGESDDGTRYYDCWLRALEKLVADKGLVLADELSRRTTEWEVAARETPHGKPVELRGPHGTPGELRTPHGTPVPRSLAPHGTPGELPGQPG
jgi:nitrile hydratase accessory protein